MKQEEQLTNQVEDTIENGTPEQVQNIAQNAPEPIANEAKQTLDNNPHNDEVNNTQIEKGVESLGRSFLNREDYLKARKPSDRELKKRLPKEPKLFDKLLRESFNSGGFTGDYDQQDAFEGFDMDKLDPTLLDFKNKYPNLKLKEVSSTPEVYKYFTESARKRKDRHTKKGYDPNRSIGEGFVLEDLVDDLGDIYVTNPEKFTKEALEKAIEEKPEQILEDSEMPEEIKEEAAQVLDSDNRTDEANNEQVEKAVEKLTEDFDTVDDLYNYLDQFGDEYGFVEEPDNKTFDEGQMISESNEMPAEDIDETIVDDGGVADYDYSDIPDPDILSQEEVQQIAFDSIQSDETLDDTTKDQLLDDVASEIDWLVGLGKAKPKANEKSSQEWLDKASRADAYMMSGATADEALDMTNLEDEISPNMSFDPNILFGESNVDVVEESIEQESDPERKTRKLRLAEYFRSKATDVGGSGVGTITQAPTTPEDRRRSVGGSFGGFKPIMSSLGGLGYSAGSTASIAPTQPRGQQETTRSVSSGRSNLLDRGTGSGSTIKAGSVGAKSSSGNMTFNGGLFGSGSTQKSSKLSKGSVRLPSGGGHTAPAGGGKLAKGKETLSGRKSTGDINIDKLISIIVSDSKNWPVNDAGNKDSEDRFNPFKLQITKENQILVKGSGLRGAHFESAIQKSPELLKAVRAYFA